MVFTKEVRGATVSFTGVTPTDASCGKPAPVGPESSSSVVSTPPPPGDKDGVGAADPGRPVGSSRNRSTLAPWWVV